ncbi:SseB family protein [Mangrovactinospora gilvigrisea]|uniref:SseB family protein n=1 Tax=Mangrovactinospora gilvigrisea TaxID=1428644 RepID=UPI000B2841F9|nr:SseB family protein [Mangrovactinospora gilvigrisea]
MTGTDIPSDTPHHHSAPVPAQGPESGGTTRDPNVRKSLPDTGFANDTGEPDAELAAALDAWVRAQGAADAAELRAAEDAVHAALPGTRLLVPVVAVLGEVEETADGHAVEKSSDMAVPTINSPDGSRRALPAFTGTAALARWRADARPVAVPAHTAARAALQERADTLLLDLGGPAPFPVSGARLYLLARGGERRAPVDDPAVAEAVRGHLAGCEPVSAAYLEQREGADLTLRLVLAGGVGREEIQRAAGDLAERLAADPVLRTVLVDGLSLALHPPGTPAPSNLLYEI